MQKLLVLETSRCRGPELALQHTKRIVSPGGMITYAGAFRTRRDEITVRSVSSKW